MRSSLCKVRLFARCQASTFRTTGPLLNQVYS